MLSTLCSDTESNYKFHQKAIEKFYGIFLSVVSSSELLRYELPGAECTLKNQPLKCSCLREFSDVASFRFFCCLQVFGEKNEKFRSTTVLAL
jgi:hypothetical protein